MNRITTTLVIAVMLAGPMLAVPGVSSAQVSVGISVRIGPPPLPVYPQPFCPGIGYIWTPGYWAYGPYGYFWVPGTWVLAPAVGFLWTPGYWGWREGFYRWHPGYWGRRVGFYGGINYGYGYAGVGYAGGYWRGRAFYYNRAVNNVNGTVIHDTYNRTVINNTLSRVSYNGGHGGINLRPTPGEMVMARKEHIPPTAAQLHQERLAGTRRTQWASVNHGRPGIAATVRPGRFNGRGVTRAIRPGSRYRPAAYKAHPNRAAFRHEYPRSGRHAWNAPYSRKRADYPHSRRRRQPGKGGGPPFWSA